ncbi:MAG: oxidoreductase, partial [Sphingobacteriales bacterium]
GLNLPRDPHYYRKELDLRLSCSYGPGRYDIDYEDNGIDYPYAYVRWTEQRNMEAFLDLIAGGRINIRSLITHTFDISDAEKAYDIVMGKVKEPHIGILLKYQSNPGKHKTIFTIKSEPAKGINIGFIGAGSFAQSYLLPNINKVEASLETVVTSKGITATNVAKKFGFNNSSSSGTDILNNTAINTVFVATQHNTHAEYVLACLRNKKCVFVEKPLAMNVNELEEIRDVYEKNGGALLVGFNRRFAPVATDLKAAFKSVNEPVVMNYRVNAGFIPKEHWTQQPEIGGGRIIGEICHFIDLMQFFSDSLPIEVFAQSINTANQEKINHDNLIINLRFANGSIGTITYVANGNKLVSKEKFEIFGGGKAGSINDFKGGELFAGSKLTQLKSNGKGHKQEVEAFISAVKSGGNMPISFESIYATTQATFAIIDSLITGLPQQIR